MSGWEWNALRWMGLLLAMLGSVIVLPGRTSVQAEAPVVVLEDFRTKDPDGFPNGWKAQRNETKARQSYTIKSEPEGAYLSATNADQRVYKKVGWDPRTHPILIWRWRLTSAPAGAEPIASVFASLDTDLMVIPVSTKYSWSASRAEGSVTEGGMFSGTEIVVQSGPNPLGQWVEERVNAYEDFKKIHNHEPAAEAWGVSLLAGPGVEVEFGSIMVSAK
ncbi:MAG: DUF3047 domain-containing protein [Nitrospira sp.]|nr:MAG: DUF3047 domain-containing protein [Nitrospira sp.]